MKVGGWVDVAVFLICCQVDVCECVLELCSYISFCVWVYVLGCVSCRVCAVMSDLLCLISGPVESNGSRAGVIT